MRKVYYLYPVLVLALFLGIIQASTLTPYWNTSTRSVGAAPVGENAPDGTTSPDGTVAPTLVDTADLKGMWTLADVEKTFQVPTSEIKAHFEIPAETSDSTAVKDLSKIKAGFEVSLLRDWLKERSPVAKK